MWCAPLVAGLSSLNLVNTFLLSTVNVLPSRAASNELAERSLPTAGAAARTVGVDEVIHHLSDFEYGPAIEGAYLALMVAGSIAVVSVVIYAYLASLASRESLIKSEERSRDK